MPSDWQDALCANYGEDAAAVLAHAEELLPGLPDPRQGLADLAGFLGAVGDPGPTLRQLRADPLALDLLLRLGGCSRYGLDLALQRPGVFWDLVQGRSFRQVWGRRTMAEALAADLAALTTPAARGTAIGLFKHHHWLRLILGDIAGELSLPAVTGELSDLTDVLAQACLELAVARIAARFGQALPTDHPLHPGLAVLGMGKLGARELNYSSDIDLILVYDLPSGEVAEVGGIDAHDWFRRVGAELIRLLESPGDAGPMFRVDMRLRPEGDRGELVLSLRETVDYYFSVGRPWERQAMIKARPIAGATAIGRRLLDELGGWIFPSDPAWEDLEESRSMRRRIEERAREADVKTGAGGIRDIEFLVQHFQLAYGGRHPELRRRDTLPTMRLLVDRGVLPAHDADLLDRHYRWLRMVEHRLQMWQDRQEHALPADAGERARLAVACGHPTLAAFDAEHGRVRREVRAVVARHFLEGSRAGDARLALLVQGEADADLARLVLEPVGLRDIARAAANLRTLALEPFFVLSRSRTERALAELMPLLLHLLAESPQPDQTLDNLVRLVAATGGRATFFALLTARPDVLGMLVDVAGWSNYLVQTLVEQPGLIDEVMDALNRRPLPAPALFAEARQLVQGISTPAEPLGFLVAREQCLAAIRDLAVVDADETARRLGTVAEAVSQVLLSRLSAERGRQWGFPLEDGRPVRFAVLALGKLGGDELGYVSDMDVVFVCDPGGACPRIDRDGLSFWTRVAQDLMRVMQEGRLFELDARLRPWGEQGELVVSTATLAGYWSQPRDLWERLAMVRARPLAGDLRLAQEVVEALRARAVGAPAPADAAAQVRAMRQRLEQSVAGKDHLKRGWGGYVDGEFVAQYLCLGRDPSTLLADSTGTVPTLRRLAAAGLMPTEAAGDLAEGVRFLRMVEGRHRLATATAVSHIPTGDEEREALARRCRLPDRRALDERLHLTRERNRFWFDRLVPG